MSGISLTRYGKGLAVRLRGARRRVTAWQYTDSSSLFMALERQRKAAPATRWRIDTRWLAVSSASRMPGLSRQVHSLRLLSSAEDLELATCYAVGALFGGSCPPASQLEQVSDEDYSILIESCMRAGSLEDGPDLREMRALAKDFIGQISNAEPRWSSPFAEIAARLRVTEEPRPELLSTLSGQLQTIKRSQLHIVGPDIASCFQALIDPATRLSDHHLRCMFELFGDWNLTGPAFAILALRAIGPFDEEKAFMAAHLESVSATLRPDVAARLHRLLSAQILSPAADYEPADYATRILTALERIAFALKVKSAPDTHSVLVALYAIDPQIADFLPWNRIFDVVDVPQELTVKALFTTMLMRSPSVQARSRRVAISVGDGAFIGDLTQFVLQQKRPEILSIFEEVKKLPPGAARALAHAILEPSIFEKLVGAFATRPALGSMASAGDNIHLMRIDAIRHANRRGLVAKSYATAEIAEEASRAKIHLLESEMRLGRVRIPWDAIKSATKTRTDELPLEMFETEDGENGSEEVIARAAEFIAEGVNRYILFDSPVSINDALSNNLRHGIVVPRVLRAFDDAIQTVYPQTRTDLPRWEEKHLKTYFGRDTARIIHLREATNTRLKAFQEVYLALAHDGDLDSRLRRRIEGICRSALQERASLEAIEHNISDATEEEVREFLAAAAAELRENVLGELLNELQGITAALESSASATTRHFLETLETNFQTAVDDVAAWTAIAERTETAPFKLEELVNLELRTAVLKEWGRLTVATRCVDRRFSRIGNVLFPIEGKYFELLQAVVHNLVSNSFKYSGLSTRTEISLSLTWAPEQMVIRCRNSIAESHLPKIIDGFSETVRRASSDVQKGAARDTLSGFLKIRRAFYRVIDRKITINVLPVTARRQHFTVEIILRDPPEIWHDKS